MKHAKGLGQLVKLRGPDRYRNELDITLLKISRGLIVSCVVKQVLWPTFLIILGHALHVLWRTLFPGNRGVASDDATAACP